MSAFPVLVCALCDRRGQRDFIRTHIANARAYRCANATACEQRRGARERTFGRPVLAPVSSLQDPPEWLSMLVANTWQRPEWAVWERVWRPELAKRGVAPDMLEPVGDPDRPTGISVSLPGTGRRSSRIDWGTDAELTAVLTGLRRLVDELDRP
jgi:hypothetical protein